MSKTHHFCKVFEKKRPWVWFKLNKMKIIWIVSKLKEIPPEPRTVCESVVPQKCSFFLGVCVCRSLQQTARRGFYIEGGKKRTNIARFCHIIVPLSIEMSVSGVGTFVSVRLNFGSKRLHIPSTASHVNLKRCRRTPAAASSIKQIWFYSRSPHVRPWTRCPRHQLNRRAVTISLQNLFKGLSYLTSRGP